jgi:hypothetical protein
MSGANDKFYIIVILGMVGCFIYWYQSKHIGMIGQVVPHLHTTKGRGDMDCHSHRRDQRHHPTNTHKDRGRSRGTKSVRFHHTKSSKSHKSSKSSKSHKSSKSSKTHKPRKSSKSHRSDQMPADDQTEQSLDSLESLESLDKATPDDADTHGTIDSIDM